MLLLLIDLKDFKTLIFHEDNSLIKNNNHHVQYIGQMLFERIDILTMYQNVVICEAVQGYHSVHYRFYYYIYLEID